MNRNDFHDYQEFAVRHCLGLEGAALFMEMGLGKTVIGLTVADITLNERLDINKWLVISTKKVVQSVWRQEAAKWDHLKHLRFSTVLGTERQRTEALRAKADIYLINRENVPWLVSQSNGKWPFDGIIVDESSSFKNHDSRRFKAIKAVLPATKRRIIMTGTPQPHSLMDLWAQIFLLDRGKRLGEKFTQFRETFFEKDPWQQFGWNLKPANGRNYEKEIADRIGDICISLQAKDYLKLPPRIDNIVEIELPEDIQKKYDDFEKQQILGIGIDREISVVNAAALTNKLLQFANGAVYDENRDYHYQHDEKLDMLAEIIENANGDPVLVGYCFKHDLVRIQERLRRMGKKFRVLTDDEDVKAWNAGEIEVLIAHPASAGHGLNLQAGGHIIVWFGLLWSLELVQQFIARLHRQGQLTAVIIHYLLVKGSMDFDVWRASEGKADSQEALMQAVKARIDKWEKQLTFR